MSQSEARAWWAEVQDVRETIERRRAAERGGANPRPRGAERSHGTERPRPDHLRAVEPALPALADEPRTHREPLRRDEAPTRDREPRPRDDEHARFFDQDALPLLESRGRAERRRTVEITGRTVGAPSLPRLVEIDRRRPVPRAIDRVGGRPDRLAMWAVMLGIVLVLAALSSSSHAAVPHAVHAAHAAHAAAAHLAAR